MQQSIDCDIVMTRATQSCLVIAKVIENLHMPITRICNNITFFENQINEISQASTRNIYITTSIHILRFLVI